MKILCLVALFIFALSLQAAEPEAIEKTAAATSAVSNESQIALNLEAPKAASTTENPVFKMILSLAVLGVLASAGFLYIKRSGFKNTKLKANQIKILTQYHLGPKKSLAIIRVAGESILVGITEQNISLIKTLSLLDEEIPETTPNQFADLLDKESQLTSKNLVAAKTQTSDEEEFSMRGIKDIVSQKMKNMRSLQ